MKNRQYGKCLPGSFQGFGRITGRSDVTNPLLPGGRRAVRKCRINFEHCLG
jgi:hypothetical protein